MTIRYVVFALPDRQGKLPKIIEKAQQLQESDKSPELVRDQLWDWAFSVFPNINRAKSKVSVSSSAALLLDDNVKVAHDDAFMMINNSREFAHLHEDGSIHVILDKKIEDEILLRNWGCRHPNYEKNGQKEIFVYAARDYIELEVLKTVLEQSYEYATGIKIESDFK